VSDHSHPGKPLAPRGAGGHGWGSPDHCPRSHDYNGTIPEKYNVVTGSHEVFAEYGNVGTKFAYIAPEGFGWMNASFQVGTPYLSAARLADLRQLKPPP
jgi:hypothetical protein